MRTPTFRRLLALALLCAGAAVAAAPTLAQETEPDLVVDVVEIAGIIDRPVESYLLERIADAERRRVELLVFQVNSLGGMKLRGDEEVRLAAEIARASVPVAVHVGPRGARAAGVIVEMLARADIASAGPSARIGPAFPIDHSQPLRWRLSGIDGRQHIGRDELAVHGANAALSAGLVDVISGGVADLLVRSDGKEVVVGGQTRRLRLPKDEIVVRFEQPGPIRRLLHTFSNPTLAYLMLIAGILLIVFELFQPGFGVAGVTGGVLFLAAAYGFTVLPVRGSALVGLAAGLGLLTLDVWRDRIAWPTAAGTGALLAGSVWLLPRESEATRLSMWLIALTVAGALIFFVPVMTVVRRARHPIATEAKRRLVGELGEVRSVLNPEGFALVDGEIWRARSEDGAKLRVGEPVVVAAVEGTVLVVRPAMSRNGS